MVPERLQPSLLDRLTDDRPEATQESREDRVLSTRQLRDGVLRDLAWLLNTGYLADVVDLTAYPEVARSVVNYGMPDLSGWTASSVDVGEVEQLVRQAIIDFEPRIIPASVRVRAVSHEGQMDRNAVFFEISCDLWAQPLPEHLFLKTEIDLETGEASVVESRGADH